MYKERREGGENQQPVRLSSSLVRRYHKNTFQGIRRVVSFERKQIAT